MDQTIVKKKLSKRTRTLIVVLAVILAFAAAWAVYTDVIVLRRTEDMVGSENSISILYVGNSHVFVGDVPRQLQTIARMYDVDITYKDLSRHGASLSDSMDNAIRDIQSGRFDYVILQDQSRRQQNDTEGFLNDIRIS